MKLTMIKAAACKYINARNARAAYLVLAIVALVLGAGARLTLDSAAAALVDEVGQSAYALTALELDAE